MAFTDIENVILSQLAYYGRNTMTQKQPKAGQPLYSILTTPKIREYLDDALGSEYHGAIDELTKKVKGKGYSIAKAMDDNKGTGFAAIAIKDPDNHVTVIPRGTEGCNLFKAVPKQIESWFNGETDGVTELEAFLRDAKTDIQLAYTPITDQQKVMEEFMQDLNEQDYNGYYFTGHSLGGNLTTYAATTCVPADKVKNVTTFNSPGFNEAFAAKNAQKVSAISDRITNYQNEYDCVSSCLAVPGKIVIVEAARTDGSKNHSLNGLKISGDGFVKNKTQKKRFPEMLLQGLVTGPFRIATGAAQLALLHGLLEMGILYAEKAKYAKLEVHFKSSEEKDQKGTLPTGEKKKKFSPLSLAITGGMLLALLTSYLIASPSGPFMTVAWIIASLLPFGTILALLRYRTVLSKLIHSKVGGITLLVLFAGFSILTPLLTALLSLLMIFGGGLLLVLTVVNVMPNTYTAILEEADGTTRTETHILGDNPDSDIARIESDYKNQGYTKK